MLTEPYEYGGADDVYLDRSIFTGTITELLGPAIDEVFTSQSVSGVFGGERWAFTSANDRTGDLGARLYYDSLIDHYFLVHPPTRPDNQLDNASNELTIANQGIPDKFLQAAQLLSLVRPAYREKLVVTGHSLGGGLAAYAALTAVAHGASAWLPRTISFDPLGLNGTMLAQSLAATGGRPHRALTELKAKVDWCYLDGGWVASLNRENNLSPVGKEWALPLDPVWLARSGDSHALENVRFGVKQLWEQDSQWRLRQQVSSLS